MKVLYSYLPLEHERVARLYASTGPHRGFESHKSNLSLPVTVRQTQLKPGHLNS